MLAGLLTGLALPIPIQEIIRNASVALFRPVSRRITWPIRVVLRLGKREREVGGGGGERRAGGAPSHTSLEHFRHVTRPTSGAKYPPEHSSQWEEPVVEACRPTEQFVHVAAAAPDRVPASQLVQIELPAKPEYLGERGVTGEWGASDASDGRRDLARAAARKEVVGRVGGGVCVGGGGGTSLPPPLVLSGIAVGARGGGGPAVRSRAASGTIDGEAL